MNPINWVLFNLFKKPLDILCTLYYIICVHSKKGGVNISPRTGRPKIDNPKKNQTKLRTTDEEIRKLEMCAKALGITKSEVLLLGLEKVYQEVIKK